MPSIGRSLRPASEQTKQQCASRNESAPDAAWRWLQWPRASSRRSLLVDKIRIVVSTQTQTHTQKRIEAAGLKGSAKPIRFLSPFELFTLVRRERNALCVLADSGTVQEKCCIFHAPNVALRDVTERPETVERESSILAGADPDVIQRCVRTVLAHGADWPAPPECVARNVGDTVIRILTSHAESLT